MFLAYLKERFGYDEKIGKAYLKEALNAGAKAIVKPWGFALYLVKGDAFLILDAYIRPGQRGRESLAILFQALQDKAAQADATLLMTFAMKEGFKQRLGHAAIKRCGFQLAQELKDRFVYVRSIEL